MKITYHLHVEDDLAHTVEVDLDRAQQTGTDNVPHAEWTELAHCKCPNCPLEASNQFCPAALDIEEVAERFVDIISHNRVDVTVETENRTYLKNCDAQGALGSLFGLLMSTSGCPILSRLKPLAYSHLPFATLEETLQRMVGAYLMKQRSIHLSGEGTPDWELTGVQRIYEELTLVNRSLMDRLRQASSQDANRNALSAFSAVSTLMVTAIDDLLETMEDQVLDGF